MDLDLACSADAAWATLVDFRRAAACVPGCESVEELEPLARYRALMRQRIGPFRLEAPVDIVIETVTPGSLIRARATGKDRVTGTAIIAALALALAPDGAAGSRLGVSADVQVSGRLASLGWPMIRQRTHDLVEEFGVRLRHALAGAAAPPAGGGSA